MLNSRNLPIKTGILLNCYLDKVKITQNKNVYYILFSD